MTVQDLIDELSKLDKSLEVGTNKDGYFYESMFVEIRTINDYASFTDDGEQGKTDKKVFVIVCD